MSAAHLQVLLFLLPTSPLATLLVAILPLIATAVGVWLRPAVVHRYWLTAVALHSPNPERRDRAERILRGNGGAEPTGDQPQ